MWRYVAVAALMVAGLFVRAVGTEAQSNSDASRTSFQHTSTERDRQHDFDFEIGTWKSHLSRLLHPLTGSTTWVEYEGTSVVRKVWNGGAMSQPTIGEFKNGRGEFFDQEPFNGRTIFVRFVISDITPNSCRFEQAFSDDGGKTWEVNWITTDTRVKDESDKAH